MRLGDLYRRAIAAGIENDPRGREAVLAGLERQRKDFDELKVSDKVFFDEELLLNPYADSRILTGSEDEEIKTVLAGVDIDVGEVLLADRLSAKGKKIDLLLSHHPSGKALAGLHAVMHMQSDILHSFGVPIHLAESLMDLRTKEIERKVMPVNHTRTVDAARLLGIPFLCLHTPADNMVATCLQRLFDDQKPLFVTDIIELLLSMPEYKTAAANGTGPKIVLGSEKRRTGKVFVDMTGGTEGAKTIYGSLTNSGVNTIVGMHISEEHRQEAEKSHMNVVIAGHIASDNLGLNLLLDRAAEDLEIFECAGFRRFSRYQK
jgi:putative NIF3 family GTP cyclohydrolase 1 type 2